MNTPMRNHFTLIFERLGAVFVFLVTISYTFLRGASDEIPFTIPFWKDIFLKLTQADTFFSGLLPLALLALAITVLVLSFLSWRKTYFYIEGNHFVYEKRTIFKKTSKLPIYNLATVNLDRNIFERLIGTAKVKVDINSSATADNTDFTFVLTVKKAQQLRDELLEIRRSLRHDEDTPIVEESGEVLPENNGRTKVVSFTNKQAFKHMVLSLPVVQLAVTTAMMIYATVTDGTAKDAKGFITVLGVALVGYAFSFLMKTLRSMDFSVEMDEKCIYISSGVLQKRSYAFEKSRINAVKITQPFLGRIFGLYGMEIAVVGIGNDKKETPQLCLLSKKAELERVMKLCVPEYICTGKELKQHPAGLVMNLIKALLIAIVPCAWLWIKVHPIAAVAVAVALIVNGILGFTTKTVSYDDNIFTYARGILSKTTGVLKYSDMQTGKSKTNLLLRKKNVGVMVFSILSQSSMKVHTTGYIDLAHFDEICRRMEG